MISPSPTVGSTATPSGQPLARTLMVMGTCSSAGKSTLVAGLCRWLSRRGLRVAPFKAQNMSNNAAVCDDGSEIGRSQALQALAAGVRPTSDMNPVLLKPEGDNRSQVVVDGRAAETVQAREYYASRDRLWPHVTTALDRLRRDNDWVVIEGAGSPAELNLSQVEIVNFAVARYCRADVLLAGDIERGGVFAQLLGTLMLLEPEERALVRGLIVNKFRGDRRLFDSGVEILESRSGVPVWGVLPYLSGLNLPEEDSLGIDEESSGSMDFPVGPNGLKVAIVRLPHVANFDDFDPLRCQPGVAVRFVDQPRDVDDADVVILPGTKNTIGDLEWLATRGLDDAVTKFARRGGHVVGICGGYQMLGREISNPDQLEGSSTSAQGLGLLDVSTVFSPAKRTRQVEAVVGPNRLAPDAAGVRLTGYEIHAGQSESCAPWMDFESGDAKYGDGAEAAEGRIWGCYLHEIFHNDVFRDAWLRAVRDRLGKPLEGDSSTRYDARAAVEAALDRLADALDSHLNLSERIGSL